MSAHKSVKDLPEGGEIYDHDKIGMLKLVSGGVGVVSVAIVLALMLFGWGEASYSYLFAFTFFFTIGVGGLFWTILHHATNSGWGIVVRRQMENVASIVPWMFVLAIPFLHPGVRGHLWEWDKEAKEIIEHATAVPEGSETSIMEAKAHELKEKWIKGQNELAAEVAELESVQASVKSESEKAYVGFKLEKAQEELAAYNATELTEEEYEKKALKKYMAYDQHKSLLAHKWFGYFDWSIPRLFIYGVVFTALVWLLRNWSIRTDKTGDERFFLRSRYWSCFFLLPFAVCFTFLVFDLLMSLNYIWFSTMWGVYLFAGAALNSMAVIIIAIWWLRSQGYLKKTVSEEHFHLMGKLMFSFVVFWAYISFSQYFLIWYANITEETQYFILRNSGGWNPANVFLVVGHFVAPFIILLWRGVKKRPGVLASVAVWNLVMHFVDIYLIIIPERGPSLSVMAGEDVQLWTGSILAFLVDILAFVGVGGLMVFAFLSSLTRSSLYPCGDPRLEESMNVVN